MKKEKVFCSFLLGIVGVMPASTILSAESLEPIVEIKEIDKKNLVVEYDINGEEVEYDVDNERITLEDGSYIQFETTVDEKFDSSLSDEELLDLQKEQEFESIIATENTEPTKERALVPSGASSKAVATYTKNIREVYGEFGDKLAIFAAATRLTSLAPTPVSAILKGLSEAMFATSAVVGATKGNLKGSFSYTLYKTNSKYTYYNSRQYAYKYKRNNLNIQYKKAGSSYKNAVIKNSKTGGWFFTEKGY